MLRIRMPFALAASLLALIAVPALAHEGDPHYRSVVREIVPATDGLSATVLDHDDELQLVNRSGEDVIVLDREGEPYARLRADGTVEVNARSSMASGENAPPSGDDSASDDDGDSADARLYASVDLLAHAGVEHAPGEEPAWTTLDRSGRYQWHDPRINYRDRPVPPQVTDTSRETKVKDWRVPLLVGGQAADVLGTLTWVGEPGAGSSFPTAAVVSLGVLVLLAAAAVLLVRHRRAQGAQT